jgi:hypothetical protein
MAADCRQVGLALRHGPAAQMRHLENGQLLLSSAIVLENLPGTRFRLPEVKQGDAVFTKQPGQKVATIRRHQAVVGLAAGRKFLRRRLPWVGEIGDANLATIEQRVGKPVATRIGEADDLGELAGRELGRHF